MTEQVELREEKFLAELTELSRKYGIVISGCGCCGSPDLSDETVGPEAYYRYENKLELMTPESYGWPG